MEYPTARALAAEVVSQKAFYLIEEAQITEDKKWIDQCERCICTLKPDMFGPLNEVNRQLLEYDKRKTGKTYRKEKVVGTLKKEWQRLFGYLIFFCTAFKAVFISRKDRI